MNWQTLPYVIPYLVSVTISVGIGIYAWRRRAVAGAAPFALMTLAQASSTLCYVFELVSPGLEAKIFWDNIQFVTWIIWPLAFLAFALQYAGYKLLHPKRTWGLLMIVPIIFLALVFTDDRHGWIRPAAWLVPGEPFSALVYGFTAPILVMTLYMYGLFLSGILALIIHFTRSRRLYRTQVGTVIIGALIPLMGTVLTLMGITLTFQRDMSPFTFAIGNLIVAWGLFRYRLFDVVPVARDTVIEGMSDIVVALDAQSRVVDLNPAARAVISRTASSVIGQPVAQVFLNWPDLVEQYQDVEEARTEVVLGGEEGRRYFDLRLSPLRDRHNRLSGRLIVARDITGRKRAEEELEQRVEARTTELAEANANLKVEIAERKRTEKALRESEEKFRSLADRSPNMIFINKRGRVVYANERCEKVTGYAREEFYSVDFDFLDLIAPEHRDFVKATFGRHMKGEEVEPYEYVLIAKDGGRVEVMGFTKLIDFEGATAILGTIIDITERKWTEDLNRAQRDLALKLGATVGLNETLRLCVEAAIYSTGMDAGGVYLIDEISGDLNLAFSTGLSPDFVEAISHYDADSPSTRVVMAGNPIYLNYQKLDVPLDDTRRREGLRAVAILPVHHEDQVIACLNIVSRSLDEIAAAGRNTIETIAAQIGSFVTRARAEESLRSSEERFSKAFNASPNVMTISALKDGRYLDINESFSRVVGYSREEVIGRTSTELELFANPEDRGRLVRMLQEQGTLRNAEAGIRTKTGEARAGLFSAELIEIKEELCLLAVMEDITGRKQAEEKIRKLNEELERRVQERTEELSSANQLLKQAKEAALAAQHAAEAASRAKSAFLANMSHELRTPLNAILGFTQLMERDATTTPKQQENLSIISRSGQHLLELINDVLEMSKIEAGQATFTETDFDLYQLLATLESMFGIRAQDKGLQLRFEHAPDVPQYIRADERKLRQVLINLLGNAVKFTEEGSVTLRVQTKTLPPSIPPARVLAKARGEEKHSLLKGKLEGVEKSSPLQGELEGVEISATHPSPIPYTLLHFEVEDTGPGIAPEEMNRIFEAFAQTVSGQEVLEGTGLGLPLSRRFVQLMGGDITVSSKVGKGSLFQFDIQVALPADVSKTQNLKSKIQNRVVGLASGQRPADSGLADGDPYRILVAEDREASRVLLVQLLTTAGFEVREAVNGQEALAVWEAWRPHLIWMDIRMPVMDGYEATKIIKSKQSKIQNLKSKIIALTAHAFEEERAAILAAGCDDFVRKPFKEAEIFDKMVQHLGIRYIYEDLAQPAEQDDDTQAQVTLTPDALANLPADWVVELNHAVSRGRAGHIFELIEQIEADHPALAGALTKLVEEYRFEELMILTVRTSPKEK